MISNFVRCYQFVCLSTDEYSQHKNNRKNSRRISIILLIRVTTQAELLRCVYPSSSFSLLLVRIFFVACFGKENLLDSDIDLSGSRFRI